MSTCDDCGGDGAVRLIKAWPLTQDKEDGTFWDERLLCPPCFESVFSDRSQAAGEALLEEIFGPFDAPE